MTEPIQSAEKSHNPRSASAVPWGWRDLVGLIAIFAAFALLVMPRMPYDEWYLSPRAGTAGQNIALAEALAWREGHLWLADDFKEDSNYGGKTYSPVGLAFTVLAVPISWIAEKLGSATPFPLWLYYGSMTASVPLICYWSLRRHGTNSLWSTVLTIGFVCGTPLCAEIASCRIGTIYSINHMLAVIGVFLIASDLLGSRRIWPAGIGLLLACWSRQMTCLYALPILWFAWRSAACAGQDSTEPRPLCLRPLILALGAIVIAAGIPLLLNYLKFGDPLDTGYVHLYADRTDEIAERARRALFGFEYLPLHLRAMHFDYPHWCVRQGKLHVDLVDVIGGSLWLTTPLTLGIFGTIRQWWRDADRRILMLGTVPVLAGLHLYHTTGGNLGMYRYALDVLPVWWLVIAPFATATASAKRLTILAVAYSILYYQFIPW